MDEQPNFDHDALDMRRKTELIDKAIEILGTDFDSVIVLASHQTETGGTAFLSRYTGNWYAQNGMMNHILGKRRTMVDHEVRRGMIDHGE